MGRKKVQNQRPTTQGSAFIQQGQGIIEAEAQRRRRANQTARMTVPLPVVDEDNVFDSSSAEDMEGWEPVGQKEESLSQGWVHESKAKPLPKQSEIQVEFEPLQESIEKIPRIQLNMEEEARSLLRIEQYEEEEEVMQEADPLQFVGLGGRRMEIDMEKEEEYQPSLEEATKMVEAYNRIRYHGDVIGKSILNMYKDLGIEVDEDIRSLILPDLGHTVFSVSAVMQQIGKDLQDWVKNTGYAAQIFSRPGFESNREWLRVLKSDAAFTTDLRPLIQPAGTPRALQEFKDKIKKSIEELVSSNFCLNGRNGLDVRDDPIHPLWQKRAIEKLSEEFSFDVDKFLMIRRTVTSKIEPSDAKYKYQYELKIYPPGTRIREKGKQVMLWVGRVRQLEKKFEPKSSLIRNWTKETQENRKLFDVLYEFPEIPQDTFQPQKKKHGRYAVRDKDQQNIFKTFKDIYQSQEVQKKGYRQGLTLTFMTCLETTLGRCPYWAFNDVYLRGLIRNIAFPGKTWNQRLPYWDFMSQICKLFAYGNQTSEEMLKRLFDIYLP